MIKTHDLIQDSDEWHQHRANHHNASDAPAMMGVDDKTSRDELLRLMHTGDSKEFSDYVRENVIEEGHIKEAAARPIAEAIIDEDLFPTIISSEFDGMKLSASLDGENFLRTAIWEHKSINDVYRNIQDVDELPDKVKIQMDQQLLVTNAEQCLFMASDGTEDDLVYFWYTTTDARKAAIIAGWKQFEKDLANYVPPAQKKEVTATAIMQLPALSIQISGQVSGSNLAVYQESAIAYIEQISTELESDQDFVDAEANIKFCKDAETELKTAGSTAIGSMSSVDEAMKMMGFLAEQLRQKRLLLEKLVKSEKAKRKHDIAQRANSEITDYLKAINLELGSAYLQPLSNDWATIMKSKRTIASLQNAANTYVANTKIALDGRARAIRDNMNAYTEITQGMDYGHLFTDYQTIIHKPMDDFKLLVQSRIDAEEKRIEEARKKEADRVRDEEAKKQEQARLEQERLEKEEHEKAERIRQKINEEAEAEEKRREEELGGEASNPEAKEKAPVARVEVVKSPLTNLPGGYSLSQLNEYQQGYIGGLSRYAYKPARNGPMTVGCGINTVNLNVAIRSFLKEEKVL